MKRALQRATPRRWRNAPAALVFGLCAAAVAGAAAVAQSEGGVSVERLEPLDLRPEAQAESLPGERVSLRAIDKMTGEVRTLEGAVGEAITFERLRIEVEACFARVGGRAPESSVFLQIFDTKTEAEAGPAFSGWMFASSPALSAMDHPRYDVWVLSCAIS